MKATRALAILAFGLIASEASAQGVTTPPSGDNQKSSVSQWIGLVEVNVTYNSPDVTASDGTDRKGKIWGQLVPYGMANLGFGTCGKACPWRAGANENTTFRVSHDVKVEGKRLRAGTYGLHMVPGKSQWTIIFSKNHSSWGSYFYDPKEDALRVTVKPREHKYTHWLSYDFIDRQPEKATVALRWENLEVPFTVAVDNLKSLYVNVMRDELRSSAGFNHESWRQAADYCLKNKTNLKEALTWADKAVNAPFIGQKNFRTLQTLADLQAANGQKKQAKKTMASALDHPTAGPLQIHQYGRKLLSRGEKQAAVAVFEQNAKKHPDAWPVHVGLARGYSAVGRLDDALKHAQKALKQAPDDPNRQNLKKMVADLKSGKPAS